MNYHEFAKLLRQLIDQLPHHDPLFLTFSALGIFYMVIAFLAGLYITYDWWRNRKKSSGETFSAFQKGVENE